MPAGPNIEDQLKEINPAGEERKLPPVHLWNPPLCGDMDLLITRDGEWIHEGRPIVRHGLVNLFASVLKLEDNQYFLVTPTEKWRIRVEIAPLFISQMEVTIHEGVQQLIFQSTTGDCFTAGPDHQIWIEYDKDGSPLPKVAVRSGLNGLISRNVYFQLAELAEQRAGDGVIQYIVKSNGEEFLLGEDRT